MLPPAPAAVPVGPTEVQGGKERDLEVFVNGGYPYNAGWFSICSMENPIKKDDDWGSPLF